MDDNPREIIILKNQHTNADALVEVAQAKLSDSEEAFSLLDHDGDESSVGSSVDNPSPNAPLALMLLRRKQLHHHHERCLRILDEWDHDNDMEFMMFMCFLMMSLTVMHIGGYTIPAETVECIQRMNKSRKEHFERQTERQNQIKRKIRNYEGRSTYINQHECKKRRIRD